MELDAVPIGNGTAGLHMLRTPSEHEGAHVLETFLDDPTVDLSLRARIKDEIMNGTIPTTEAEHMTVAERVRAEGVAIGEQRGREQGLEQGSRRRAERDRQVLLAQVRSVLGDEAADSLEGIRDFETLCARACAALAERR